ncbi:MAG: GNAT family N-acetyltransferase [Myxococcales bacterium]|nr:MAG: GNAT family N-acetyltransferase [Myxococcales bacterium]
MEQAIIGYHRDAEGDWVAELACGHGQHVRHKPPWTVRPWVTTEEGRQSKLGALLECKRCGTLRPYVPADRDACLVLLRRSVPEHSASEDEAQFRDFLNRLPASYFVVEDDQGLLLASGGLVVEPSDPSRAKLCWCIVDPDRQRQGLGRAVALHCLRAAPAGVSRVHLETSHEREGFYEELALAAAHGLQSER